ncbi:MAG: hypothetical protein ACKVPY_05360 [Paracoccaceae bacterium]
MSDVVSRSKASLLPDLAEWEETQGGATPRLAFPLREVFFLPAVFGAAVAAVLILVALAG